MLNDILAYIFYNICVMLKVVWNPESVISVNWSVNSVL